MHSLVFDKEKNRFYVEYAGDVVFAKIRELFLEVINHPEFQRSMDMLLEYKHIKSLGAVEEGIEFGKFQDNIAEKRGFGYSAAIVCYEEKYFLQLAKMIECSRSTEGKAMVFRSKEEALEWLDQKQEEDKGLYEKI